jgi:hypothetical protein
MEGRDGRIELEDGAVATTVARGKVSHDLKSFLRNKSNAASDPDSFIFPVAFPSAKFPPILIILQNAL